MYIKSDILVTVPACFGVYRQHYQKPVLTVNFFATFQMIIST